MTEQLVLVGTSGSNHRAAPKPPPHCSIIGEMDLLQIVKDVTAMVPCKHGTGVGIEPVSLAGTASM